MGQLLLISLSVIITIWSIKKYINLCRNIKIAEKINVEFRTSFRENFRLTASLQLPYIIVPFFTGTLLWFFIAPVIIPILRYGLPSRWNRKWIESVSFTLTKSSRIVDMMQSHNSVLDMVRGVQALRELWQRYHSDRRSWWYHFPHLLSRVHQTSWGAPKGFPETIRTLQCVEYVSPLPHSPWFLPFDETV